ncbi:hypothetical protein PG994_001615 [Apiospora phragmitis]|uniref:Uncharacterized protein n=1 Tax=Apiospora phragmitis TaxID=2905665 RepID=A0ABR1WU13_9PEZI
MDSSGQVYLGVWTNWSLGPAAGASLTMTREQGNLLIAFTALFVPFVASRFWRIFAILFHQCYSTPHPRDTIHHQRQVVLRNATSPESGLISFLRLLWAWRGQRPWLRVLPIALFALLSIVAFTVAGGFSSKIATTGEVLLKGDSCRASYLLVSTNMTEVNLSRSHASTFINNMASYAQQCYSKQSSGQILECAKFVTRTIPTATMDYNASCPFKSGICRRDNSNIRFDTGHLDSNRVFGLNLGEDSSLTFRYVLQCAPLATEGRSETITVSNQNFTTYNYGPHLSARNDTQSRNFTHLVPDIETQYSPIKLGLVKTINFLLTYRSFSMFQGSFNPRESDFKPDPDLIRRDGDVSLAFLSGNGVYLFSRTDDDWYKATVNTATLSSASNPDQALYRPEEAASPLGCVQQFQYCRDPTKGQCGSLLIWTYFNLMPIATSLKGVIDTLGPTSLAPQTFLQQGMLSRIQENQWQLDVERWWQIVLAGFQATFVNTAQGSGLFGTVKPENEHDWEFCRNQKIRSAEHASFSILGLALTYSAGAIIIIISFIIAPILGLLQKYDRYNKYAYLEWEGDTAIQLHRVAQDELGHGHWSRCDETIPITQPDDLLAPLDLSDPKHPCWLVPLGQGLTPSEGSSKQSAESSSGHTYVEVRRACSDAHALDGNHSYGLEEELDDHQNRPNTAP